MKADMLLFINYKTHEVPRTNIMRMFCGSSALDPLSMFQMLSLTFINVLQAGAPEGACHDNVKSLGKKHLSTVGLSFTDI